MLKNLARRFAAKRHPFQKFKDAAENAKKPVASKNLDSAMKEAKAKINDLRIINAALERLIVASGKKALLREKARNAYVSARDKASHAGPAGNEKLAVASIFAQSKLVRLIKECDECEKKIKGKLGLQRRSLSAMDEAIRNMDRAQEEWELAYNR